ncbi:MAG: DedA family protein [Candidatus Sericytochromatia bacterium]
MHLLAQFVDLFLHLDKHLEVILQQYGNWIYALLFLIVFCETGLVVTPLLPGDSLLFAAGAFAAKGNLNIGLIFVLLISAALLGDNVNYWVGRSLGPKVFSKENSRIFKRAYLDKTQAFYDKYGGKTVIMARFIPIVRTFAPFVAGIGRMRYLNFLAYSVAGALLWVTVCTLSGFFLGNIPVVKKNFELAVLAIIGVSVLPMALEFYKHRKESRLGQGSQQGPEPASETVNQTVKAVGVEEQSLKE